MATTTIPLPPEVTTQTPASTPTPGGSFLIGAKLTATLLREMPRRNARYGMVTMCVGGGMGAAGIFEAA